MKTYIFYLSAFFFILLQTSFVRAEVVVDGSVGIAGRMKLSGPDYRIHPEFGAQVGSNLFHSFEQFNLTSGESATFSGPASVENIISRITGGDASSINGLIRSVISGADLYLINPAGIMFGPDASIDLTGSLHITTADYLQMGQTERFYAMPVQGESLSVASPSAFGFLDDSPGGITFEGSSIDSIGKTLSVIGGDIDINSNAQLSVNSGRLNLASVGGENEAVAGESGLDFATGSFGSINITGNDTGRPSTLYANSGSLYIRGGKFVVDNGEILAETPFTNQKTADTAVDIQADSIEIKNNSLISTDTFGPEQGADLTLHAEENITVSDSKLRVGAIGAKATGDAGILSIQGKNVYLDNSARIESESKDSAGGNAGDVRIAADERVTLSDSSISTFTAGSGCAGGVSISASEVTLGQNSAIQTFTQGIGNAGDVSIDAGAVIIESGTLVRTETEERGKGGGITITADRLNMSSGAELSSAASAEDNGGDAGDITLVLSDAFEMSRSGLRTDAVSSGGGKILVNAKNSVSLLSSEMTTSVQQGAQNGGDILIGDPEKQQGSRSVVLSKSTVQANADEGDGGAIFIVTDTYFQSADSLVEASSKRGNDGSIRIEAPDEDMISGLAVLPANFLDASRWVKNPCGLRGTENVSRFVVKSQDGVPAPFDDYLSSPLDIWVQDIDNEKSGLSALVREGDFPTLIEQLGPMKTGALNAALRADAYVRIGHYQDALEVLYQVLPSLEEAQPSVERAVCFSTLSDLFLSLGNPRGAIEYVKKALSDARQSGMPEATASVLNHLGNIRAVSGDRKGAVKAYGEGLQLLKKKADADTVAAVIAVNAGRLAFKADNQDAFRTAAETAMHYLKKQTASYSKGVGLIALGLLENGRSRFLSHADDGSDKSFSCFQKALAVGDTLKNHNLISAASGYSGRVFESRNHIPEARQWTLKAILEAQSGGNAYLLYQWQWQTGRLYTATGNTKNAVHAYRTAMTAVKPFRMEFLNGFRDRRQRFETNIRKMYMELASLLTVEPDRLQEAVDTLESMETAELQHYYQDECLASRMPEAAPLSPAALPEQTALVYLTPMPDTLEILLMSQNGITAFQTRLSMSKLRRTVRRFREKLQETEADVMDEASRLYQWIVHPLEAELERRAVRTLVIVPSGLLRLLPFAALYDGRQFLIEKYALATIPAARLTDLGTSAIKEKAILLNGLSEGRENMPPLSNVPKELEEIQHVMGGKVLMDRTFTITNLKNEFLRHSYDMVHMATHAVFGNSPDETFLLTYDGKLTMNQLELLMGAGQVQGKQLELLTLSACETAVGDEQAAFGLAGIAVKAGVKSTLATLWQVDDRAAMQMFSTFYSRLAVPGTTKAAALQQAQQTLINNSAFRHPSSWAPFLLIGNWL